MAKKSKTPSWRTLLRHAKDAPPKKAAQLRAQAADMRRAERAGVDVVINHDWHDTKAKAIHHMMDGDEVAIAKAAQVREAELHSLKKSADAAQSMEAELRRRDGQLIAEFLSGVDDCRTHQRDGTKLMVPWSQVEAIVNVLKDHR